MRTLRPRFPVLPLGDEAALLLAGLLLNGPWPSLLGASNLAQALLREGLQENMGGWRHAVLFLTLVPDQRQYQRKT